MFVAVFFRLVVLQTAQAESLTLRAVDQWTREVPITGERGGIYDSTGKLLAACETVYTVYVRPNAVTDKISTARGLSAVLGVDGTFLLTKMRSGVSEVTVKKNVEKSKVDEIRNLDLTGVYFAQNVKRVYPHGDFLSAVLGFCNVDCVGQTGVEAFYNGYLIGKDGQILTETDLVGRETENAGTYYIEGKKGCDVYLTVDYAIQSFMQSAVDEAREINKAKSASCIMMNAQTGAILGLARSPSYDLNNLPRDNLETLMYLAKNTLVCDVNEPGSTFKILTAALALENGVASVDSTAYCPGYRIVDGQRIKCWKTIGHGSQSFQEGVQNSCNCLFMDLALKLGKERLYEGFEKFGISSKTGVDISGEGKGLFINKETAKNVDVARMGFGQAVAVTPIGLLTACCSVINGGELLTPYIVEKAVSRDGKVVYQGQKKVKNRTVSDQTSQIMRETLYSVVAEGGGKNAAVPGFKIGGKTGTAQKYVSNHLANGLYLSSFVGFAPIENPWCIMLMMVDEPSAGAYYGSVVAAPQAAKIFSQTFSYLGWEPEGVKIPEKIIMPELIGLSIQEADKALKEAGLTYQYLERTGKKITYQIPAAGSEVTKEITAYIEG